MTAGMDLQENISVSPECTEPEILTMPYIFLARKTYVSLSQVGPSPISKGLTRKSCQKVVLPKPDQSDRPSSPCQYIYIYIYIYMDQYCIRPSAILGLGQWLEQCNLTMLRFNFVQ